MLSQFKNFTHKHDLFDPKDRVLLAVSGGLDSMAMLHLFQQLGSNIGVAHCNFQLRGKESDADESFIKVYCKKAGLKFFTKAFDTKNYAEEAGLSTQMAARELRYGWFTTLMEEENYHWLATAHHLNDNIETVLSRWVKGASLDQLTGIPIKNQRTIRPLLFATRQDILAYAKKERIKWREDSSNGTNDYQRNFIRHKIIPLLKEINPSLENTFIDSLEKIKGSYELMQRGIGQLKDSITRMEGQRFFIDKHLLLMLKYPEFVCYEWLRLYGFEWDRCVQLVATLGAQSGKTFLSATHQAVIDREYIIVSPREASFTEVLIEEGQDKAGLGPWQLAVLNIKTNGVSKSKNSGSFDQKLIKFPMVWRKWRKGDSFIPLGLGGRKKVSDFLIDEKIPVTEKSHVTVLESGGEIVWVVGYRVDDRFKVTSATTSVLQVTLTSVIK